MEKASKFYPNTGRPNGRRGQVPRPVVWLAMLIALVIAALGAMISPSVSVKASVVSR